MSTQLILVGHIALGVAVLLLGPIAMWVRKYSRLHARVGELYHWIILGVCLSAVALAVLDWSRLWWFALVATGSYAFALLGYVSAKVRWTGWLRAHVTGQGGSYIAMTTALLVVNWSDWTGMSGAQSLWAWAIPTILGSPIIAWTTREVALGRRPKQ